jgi:hypothetical protein
VVKARDVPSIAADDSVLFELRAIAVMASIGIGAVLMATSRI